jgi:hypothetical protein
MSQGGGGMNPIRGRGTKAISTMNLAPGSPPKPPSHVWQLSVYYFTYFGVAQTERHQTERVPLTQGLLDTQFILKRHAERRGHARRLSGAKRGGSRQELKREATIVNSTPFA